MTIGKLDRLETNVVTKFVLFIKERELMALKYWHLTVTKDVMSTNRVDTQTAIAILRVPIKVMVSKL